MLDVIDAFLLLINQSTIFIVKDANVVVKDLTIIVLGLQNVLEEEIFFIFME